jgi:hypothetical protein
MESADSFTYRWCRRNADEIQAVHQWASPRFTMGQYEVIPMHLNHEL